MLANVIYLNDELGEIQSSELEIPFVINKKTSYDSDAVLEPSVGIFDVDVMVKRGREIYFDANVKANVNVTTRKQISFVAGVESNGELPEKDGAIEIYFGREGESLWSIAKNLKIPSDMIINQNPELNDPLEKDQNIAVYYQKIKK